MDNWTVDSSTTISSSSSLSPVNFDSLSSADYFGEEYEDQRKLDLCGSSNINNSVVNNFKFYGCGVTISILGCAGIIGNILSFITIATLPKRNLFNKLLLTLTVFDTLFIANGGIFMVQQEFKFKNSSYNFLLPWLIYPLAGIAMTGSTYTCIAIALERFLGICYAHSDIPRHSRYYILAITIISIIIDFPRFFEIHSIIINGEVHFSFSSLRKNEYYLKFYIFWFRLFATAAIPFILMFFFNLKILIHYRKNSFMNGQNSSSFNNSSHERSLYITFFCLTTTFLVCHLPRIILNINELNINRQKDICKNAFPDYYYYYPTWIEFASCVEKILLIFNSSVNFVFYCLAGKSFRRQLIKMLLPSICLRRYFDIGDNIPTGLTESGIYLERTRATNSIRQQQRQLYMSGSEDEELMSNGNSPTNIIPVSVTLPSTTSVIKEESEEEDEEEEKSNLIQVEEEVDKLIESNESAGLMIRSCSTSADLVNVRIQQRPRQCKSELKLYSDHTMNTKKPSIKPNSSCRSIINNNNTDNELLGIYDIRITIHHKQLGSAL